MHQLIIGNNLDLELENKREISYEEGKKFSEEKNMEFFEVSVKTEKNLLNMLFYLFIFAFFFLL